MKKPLPKVKSETFGMGWITGLVFLDENGNKVLDEQEKVFKNVQILVNDQPLAATDQTGRFAVYGLKPYTPVKVGLDLTTLDALYLPVEEAIWIETRPGDALEMDFGVVPCSGITGTLRGTVEELEALAGKAAVVLTNLDGEEVERVEVEYDGFFLIDRVLPGSYLLRMSLPEGWEGRQIIEPTSYRIEVLYGEMPKWYDGIIFELSD